jgi:hypothetical protein
MYHYVSPQPTNDSTSKLVSEEQVAAHQAYVIKAGLKGLIAGFAITVPISLILQRRSPNYRSLTTSLKVFGLIGLPIPVFAVAAEHASLEFDRLEWYECQRILIVIFLSDFLSGLILGKPSLMPALRERLCAYSLSPKVTASLTGPNAINMVSLEVAGPSAWG